tara:strand:- start:318 stop:911 length:594 start_codon:yes stop_codon:yes gene_type:complete
MLKKSYGEGIEIGCDEAGRGCLAGPVVAAAVLLPKDFENSMIKDSKKLNKNQRIKLEEIIKNHALSYGIGVVSPKKIDEINILNSSFLAMHYAINKIKTDYNLILIDGNRFKKYKNKEHKCIIKGDTKYMSIAAASIIAKTHRDRIMEKLHDKYPKFSWNTNKGYPTKKHKESILKFGANIHHRKSFNLLTNQLSLF